VNRHQDLRALEKLRGSDLFLAWACSAGRGVALATFERAHAAAFRAIWLRAGGRKPSFDDFAQAVRTKLFVGEAAKIADYSGHGQLQGFVGVVASRTLLDMARTRKDEVALPEEFDGGPLAMRAPDDDPELQYLKRKYRAEMREAFEEAARSLDPEERNVLREHYAHGLGIDQIAAVHGIHRATAARRLAVARESVLRSTRQLLMRRLHMSRDELESVVRLIESQMHVTVERVLG